MVYSFSLSESYIPAQADTDIRDTTVGGLLRQTAARHPDAPALVEIDMAGEAQRRWIYAELLRNSETLAEALSTRFEPGERICVWAPNQPEWILMEYACALAGLTLVTANPAYQASELRFVLEQSRSSALFLVESYRGNPMAEIGAEAVHGLDSVREVTDLDDHQALFAHGNRPVALPEVAPMAPAQIQYTSGTTGFPKGAVLCHRSITNNARLYGDRMGAKSDDVWSCYMPLFHTAGCAMITLGAMQRANPIVLFKVFDPAMALKIMEQEKVTLFLGVPTMMVAMLECLEHQDFDLAAVRVAVSGGSMVAPDLVRSVKAAFNCDFQTVYGQTETSPLITQHHLGETLEDICTTIGQPIPQTEVSIRKTDNSGVVGIGETGEICVRGFTTMLEYNDNPDATAATIDADGWLHTGDLGNMDARGYLKITGRVKEMIIRGGENLFPAEIENTLLDHPDVAEVAVVGLPDPKWGEIVAAFIRPEPGQVMDAEALRSHCRQNMSPQKTPAVWRQVSEFPLTGSGKIQKFALRERFEAGEFLET
ncbi:MAG: AMP-binding protein [Pseudomonadota bacterium]